MIVTYNNTDFTLIEGVYYSKEFKIETKDTFISIEATLNSNGTVSIQNSIDGINWYTIINSTFNCNPNGFQSYLECQPELLFRLISTTEFISAKIVL